MVRLTGKQGLVVCLARRPNRQKVGVERMSLARVVEEACVGRESEKVKDIRLGRIYVWHRMKGTEVVRYYFCYGNWLGLGQEYRIFAVVDLGECCRLGRSCLDILEPEGRNH